MRASGSDSEYERLLLIPTPLSYKLNLTTSGTSPRQNSIVREVVEVTKRLYATEMLNDLIFRVVDETLKHVFREAGAKVIYDYLENNHHLKREEIGEKPRVFSAGLGRLLGSGAPVTEKMILENLYRRLELRFEEKKDHEFSDYLKEVRSKWRFTVQS